MNALETWMLEHLLPAIRVVSLAVIGLVLIRTFSRLLGRVLTQRLGPQTGAVLANAVRYTLTVLLIVTGLQQLGFRLGALLGAAGVAGVALGFASQTSLSNIISGAFLVWERPFAIDDVIEVDGVTGIVHSIDLLATYLRTFDNRLVRIPNETLVKSRLTNVTRFPIRRLDLPVGVAYKEDIARVTRILLEVADANPLCLDEPAPLVIFNGFGASSLDFVLAVWFSKNDYLDARNSLLRDVKTRFDADGIEIPFPHVSVYAGEATKPFPVRAV